MKKSPHKQQAGDTNSEMRGIPISTAISLCALCVSLVSLMYTMRAFTITHRPYVGIADTVLNITGESQKTLVWKLRLKNVGSIPAVMPSPDITVTLTSANGVPHPGDISGRDDQEQVLMPGEITELSGQYTEGPELGPMTDLLSGAAVIKIVAAVPYRAHGWLWDENWYYHAIVKTHVQAGLPPAWAMVRAEAD